MTDINILISEALKAKDNSKLKAYRNVKSEFLLEQKKHPNIDFGETDQIRILQKMISTLTKDLEIAEKAGRNDLVDEAKEEIQIISDILPEIPTDAEIEKFLLESQLVTHVLGESEQVGVLRHLMGNAITNLSIEFPTASRANIANIVKKHLIC